VSTSSDIILHDSKKNTYRSIYCHWDGYLSHNGRILLTHYNQESLVEDLIKLGGLSELDAHTEMCIAYHRDRGEPLKITIDEDLGKHRRQDYSYLFKGGQWFYTSGGSWKILTIEECEKD